MAAAVTNPGWDDTPSSTPMQRRSRWPDWGLRLDVAGRGAGRQRQARLLQLCGHWRRGQRRSFEWEPIPWSEQEPWSSGTWMTAWSRWECRQGRKREPDDRYL